MDKSIKKEGWTNKKLGEVCKRITDGSHNPPKGILSSNYLMISSQNVFNDNIKLDDVRYLSEEDFIKENKRTNIKSNDVLLTIVGTIGRCAVVNDNIGNITLQRSVAVLSPTSNINSRFLMYCCIGNNENLNKNAHGVAQRGIYLKQLCNIAIPVPSLEEQLQVVSELDLLSCVIEKQKSQLEELDKLAQSIFYDMFGDPVTNEKGWKVKKFGDECTDMKYGTSRPACENGRFKYLRMGNITMDGHLDLTDLKTIDIPEDEIEKCIVRYGDILFNRTNSHELIGKTCMFDLEEEMIIAGYIIRVRLSENLLPQYIATMFNLPSFKKLLRTMAKGAVNQANINSKELASIRISLPPLSLQQEFAAKIEAIELMKSKVRSSLQESEQLFNSRMDYYFN